MSLQRRRMMMQSSVGGIDPNNPIFANYLTIEALEDGLTVSLSRSATEYCIDGSGEWVGLPAATATPAVSAGHYVSFRGSVTPANYYGVGTFTINKKCNLLGNCMSLLFKDSAATNMSLAGKNYAFYELFKGASTVIGVSANFLPATVLANYCYNYMFRDCTSLTTAPDLPALSATQNCYAYMFYGCSNLATAMAVLPATSTADASYNCMFSDCSSLTTAPAISATSLATNSCNSMFSDCTSLTTAPAISATSIDKYACGYMFSDCTSLTTAPLLAPTTLAEGCYSSMFNGCSKLNYIKALFTTTPSSTYTNNWVKGVASRGTFVKSRSATWNVTGVYGSPKGWTIQKE